MPSVSVSRGDDPRKTTREALKRLGTSRIRNARVLLKTDAARPLSPETGEVTHPEVISAAIDYFREKGAADIAVGDSPVPGTSAEEAFRASGLSEVARRKGVRLLDFDRSADRDIAIPGGLRFKRLTATALLNAFDFIVSMPVMRPHPQTGAALSYANLKGVMWGAQKLALYRKDAEAGDVGHPSELDLALADLATAVRLDMVIIDGTVSMRGRGPAAGREEIPGLVVAGTDPLAADMTAARLMGIDPHKVPHLNLIAQQSVNRHGAVAITPENYLEWRAAPAPVFA